MNNLLQQKELHEKKCESCVQNKNSQGAFRHALKAAELSFQLAKQTLDSAVMAERHVRDGEEWLDVAEKLKQKSGFAVSATNNEAKDDSEKDWNPSEKPDFSFDQIAGMHEAKQAIMEMVVYPLQHADKARDLGLNAGGGVLLYGPPGNGKTLLGKAIAGEIDAPFFYASGAQLRSKWHGESEQNLSKIIQSAKSEKLAVLFFDEVDGLLPKRRSDSSAMDTRMVTQFLSEIGGFTESDNTLLLLGATNKPWDIDEAVFRTGRFDEKIYIPPPDDDARLGILKLNLKGVSLWDDVDLETWAEKLDRYTGSDISGIVMGAKRAALRRSIAEQSNALITNDDLLQASESIPSSITSSMITQFEQFKYQRNAGA